jgi:hypothetical protein
MARVFVADLPAARYVLAVAGVSLLARPIDALRCADECLKGCVECVAGIGCGVASAGYVSTLGLQPGREGITDGLEGGVVIARDD